MAITSRENSDSSMPARPWVTPSHMAGHAAGELGGGADLAHGLLEQRRDSASNGWWADSMSL